MTDERSKTGDDAWVDALEGKPASGADDGPYDARLIRAAIEAQNELTAEGISDDDVETARRKLMGRLGGENAGVEAAGDASTERSAVVDLSARRPSDVRRSVWRQNPGMLLAASVAFVAIVVMVLRNPDVPDGPMLVMSYGEVDTLRGAADEIVFPVEDPAAFGLELAAALTEREIPFILTADTPESAERIVNIQVDGVPNAAGVEETLEELGVERPSSSILTLRLVAR